MSGAAFDRIVNVGPLKTIFASIFSSFSWTPDLYRLECFIAKFELQLSSCEMFSHCQILMLAGFL